MHIEHVAFWTLDLERLRSFYETYFHAKSNDKYVNEDEGFESYFLTFEKGPSLEIMIKPGVHAELFELVVGYSHLAFSVGSEKVVDELTVRLENDGFPVLRRPRRTGDGYYESLVADPDGNHVEITV